MLVFGFLHSTHNLHQLKKAWFPLRRSPASDAKFVSTELNMLFHALVWHHAMRARFSISTLGQVVPR